MMTTDLITRGNERTMTSQVSCKALRSGMKNTTCDYIDLQDSLGKLMHFLPQLSDFVPLKNGFYSFHAQTA